MAHVHSLASIEQSHHSRLLPLPNMHHVFQKLSYCSVFTALDLCLAYYHVAIYPDDQYKSAFVTSHRLFEWTRMTFGFTNAPATFQRAIDHAFAELNFVVVYLDDVIVASKTEGEHLQHLIAVFERLHAFHLKLKLLKCFFFMRTLEYL